MPWLRSDPEKNKEYWREYRRRKRADGDQRFLATRRACNLRAAKNRRERIRAIIRAAKNKPCVDCGNKYPPEIMDLDHVRGTKLFNISRRRLDHALPRRVELAYHGDTIRILHTLRPRGVAMAGADVADPFRD